MGVAVDDDYFVLSGASVELLSTSFAKAFKQHVVLTTHTFGIALGREQILISYQLIEAAYLCLFIYIVSKVIASECARTFAGIEN